MKVINKIKNISVLLICTCQGSLFADGPPANTPVKPPGYITRDDVNVHSFLYTRMLELLAEFASSESLSGDEKIEQINVHLFRYWMLYRLKDHQWDIGQKFFNGLARACFRFKSGMLEDKFPEKYKDLETQFEGPYPLCMSKDEFTKNRDTLVKRFFDDLKEGFQSKFEPIR